VTASNGIANFNEKLEFKSNLFKEKDDLAKKLVFFHLKEKEVCLLNPVHLTNVLGKEIIESW
jgi:hypothetical protein